MSQGLNSFVKKIWKYLSKHVNKDDVINVIGKNNTHNNGIFVFFLKIIFCLKKFLIYNNFLIEMILSLIQEIVLHNYHLVANKKNKDNNNLQSIYNITIHKKEICLTSITLQIIKFGVIEKIINDQYNNSNYKIIFT
ncbi:hypothetical protein RFI_03102 [Reticulomyxa filosa]|uniref:Uncharacterized protein n=1 Tax=Reticulomyxa filosa TaxID=46433 RepID=X6P8L6_RETFI|nr:hypothetical protein RFI_03102 [Reticulomyxa filosa]|eukprot:ETO33992.1 hypothetical protein RFI_03102 [Reticulomyxa filosa]